MMPDGAPVPPEPAQTVQRVPGGGMKVEAQLLSSDGTWLPHVLAVQHGVLLLRELEEEDGEDGPSLAQRFFSQGDGDAFDLQSLVSAVSGEGLLESPAVALLPGLETYDLDTLDRLLLLTFME